MAVPCTIIMAATVLTALMPPIYCLDPNLPFPLNMAPESVDDKYENCTEEMEEKVNSTYFNNENEGKFKEAWERAKNCSNKQKDPEDRALTKNHIQAICAYTSNDIYKEFNEAVRTNRSIYDSSFKFHYLHFWLTTAIQTLNRNNSCYTTYRRTRDGYTGNVNDTIRFGTFASSSFRTNITTYGSKTCFKIQTCLGAFLKNYPMYECEEEVLIPPYETFKIIKITEGPGKFPDMKDCKKVFILESEGDQSYLNCKSKATKSMREQSLFFFCFMYLLGPFTVLNININI